MIFSELSMARLLWFVLCLAGSGLSQNSSHDSDQDDGMFIQKPTIKTPTQEVPVLDKEAIEEAIIYGFNMSNNLLTGEASNATVRGLGTVFNDPDFSAGLDFFFHEPSEDSLKKSCIGMGFVEATKYLLEKHFQGVEPEGLAGVFEGLEMNRELCYTIVKKACDLKHLNESYTKCSPESRYRSYDGSCNNLDSPLWGAATTAFTRFLQPAYGDGVSSLRGSGTVSLPSPRLVSVELQKTQERPPLHNFTMMVMQWGQFLSHDLSLTPEVAVKKNGTSSPLPCCIKGVKRLSNINDNCHPIDTSNDTFYQEHGIDCIRFVRSLAANKGCHFGAREQLNQQTSFLDASMVYGSNKALAMDLRTLEGGMLKGSYMGGKTFDYLTKKTKCKRMFPTCFASGDGRVDEAAGLTSIHTMFHRLHNIIASNLSDLNPHWNDEKVYQEGRHIVGAIMQQVTYKEYLPLIIGPETMKKFQLEVLDDGYLYKYHNGCNPSVANAFSTAAFRFGHTLIKEKFKNGLGAVPLQGNFFNISNFVTGKTCPSTILAGLTEDPPAGNDAVLTPAVFQHLFAPMGMAAGMDLMALNIQRGRDHGLPGYLKWRHACKLSTPTDFEMLLSSNIMNEDHVKAFKAVYKDVDDIDLFPAGLAEKPLPGAMVGPTFACIIGQQFQNTKLGDRFWYENGNQPGNFTLAQLSALRKIRLTTILCKSTSISQMQPESFISHQILGNSMKPCSSYETLDLSAWQD